MRNACNTNASAGNTHWRPPAFLCFVLRGGGVHSQLHDNLAERAVEHTLRSRIRHRSFQLWSAVDSWFPTLMTSHQVVRLQKASRIAEVPKRIPPCAVVCSLSMVFKLKNHERVETEPVSWAGRSGRGHKSPNGDHNHRSRARSGTKGSALAHP